jgi:hypothetical protein
MGAMPARRVTVTDSELLGFFEREPDADDYGGLAFNVVRGPHTVAFGIDPVRRDVSIAIVRDGAKAFELVALGVPDVRWRGEGQRERLEIVLGDKHSVFLELRPGVAIVHHLGIVLQV